MTAEPYTTLAAVYPWLVPDALLEPEGAVAAFDDVVGTLLPGGRVLDCAAGTGQLAVGLALRGFDVVATDGSAAMLDGARQLAESRGARLHIEQCRWEELHTRFGDPFDAVFCVGNSLVHAEGARARQASLAAMAAVLRPGGLLVVTSRNWEQVRAEGAQLNVADRLVVRDGLAGLVIRTWDVPAEWDTAHTMDVAVVLLHDDSTLTTHQERLTYWPFRHTTLEDQVGAAGLTIERNTYTPAAERYMVVARR